MHNFKQIFLHLSQMKSNLYLPWPPAPQEILVHEVMEEHLPMRDYRHEKIADNMQPKDSIRGDQKGIGMASAGASTRLGEYLGILLCNFPSRLKKR